MREHEEKRFTQLVSGQLSRSLMRVRGHEELGAKRAEGEEEEKKILQENDHYPNRPIMSRKRR